MAKRRKKTAEEIATENELLKLKMMAEFGGKFHGSSEIPPEIENQFLKQINKFHSAHHSAPLVTIYEMIGKPEYNHVHDVSDKTLKKELKAILKPLKKKGIHIETLSGVSDRELYRFITEEVFKQEMQDLKLKNWVTQIVYEDYHPSNDFDITQLAHQAVQFYFDENFIAPEFIFAEQMKNQLGLGTDLEELTEQASTFRKQFHRMAIEEVLLSPIQYEGSSHAIISAHIAFKAQKAKGRIFQKSNLVMHVEVMQEEHSGMWVIEKMFLA
ncbi:MAG: hypothetical protein U0T73_11675 [Chitinophagales bacterium]